MSKMYALAEWMCYVRLVDGNLQVCRMVKDGNGYCHPQKNGYKPAWDPNINTSEKFLAAVEKITGMKYERE